MHRLRNLSFPTLVKILDLLRSVYQISFLNIKYKNYRKKIFIENFMTREINVPLTFFTCSLVCLFFLSGVISGVLWPGVKKTSSDTLRLDRASFLASASSAGPNAADTASNASLSYKSSGVSGTTVRCSATDTFGALPSGGVAGAVATTEI